MPYDLNGIVEMFCAPQCFEIYISEKVWDDIVKGFKATTKKLAFFITEDDKGHSTLGVTYICK